MGKYADEFRKMGDSGDKDGKKSDAYEEAAEQTRETNRAAAKQWMELMEACEAEAGRRLPFSLAGG